MKTLLLTLFLLPLLQGHVTARPQSLDLNMATRSQLMAVDPIVTQEIADAILKGRPYKTFDEVAARIPKEVYEGIRFKLLVGTRVFRPCRNVNTSSKTELMEIEGITDQVADAIIKGRPYTTAKEFFAIQAIVPKEVDEKKLLCMGGAPNPGAPNTNREVQVIPGNKTEKLIFERQGAEAPSDKPNAPQ